MEKKQKDFHYYAFSVDAWTTASTQSEAKRKLNANSSHKMTALLKVPLPLDAEYDIRFYIPIVEGCKVVTGADTLQEYVDYVIDIES